MDFGVYNVEHDVSVNIGLLIWTLNFVSIIIKITIIYCYMIMLF
jgi:hypothetical protein